MTRSKFTKGYPVQFLDLVEALEADPIARIPVQFESEKQAQDFRLDFYTFRAAALREGLDKTFPVISAVYMELDGTIAVVMHKDHSPLAMKLSKAIQQAKEAKKGEGGSE